MKKLKVLIFACFTIIFRDTLGMCCLKPLLLIGCQDEFEMIHRLIQLGLTSEAQNDLKSTNAKGKTVFHDICSSGDLQKLRSLIKYCDKEIVTECDQEKNTPLSLACSQNNSQKDYNYVKNVIEMAKLLLPYYDNKYLNYGNLLSLCGQNKNLELAKLLVLNGTDFWNSTCYVEQTVPEYFELVKEYNKTDNESRPSLLFKKTSK
jgi:hypothetical protein